MKKYLILLSVIFVSVYFFLFEQNTSSQVEVSAEAGAALSILDENSATNSISSANVSSATADFNVISSNDEKEKNKSTSVNLVEDGLPQDFKIWRRSRGFFSDEDLQEYEGFKLEKLEELANKGDLKAIEVLRQYELSSGNMNRYKELVDLAAVHGSLRSIRLLIDRTLGDYIINDKTEADLLEHFAYMHLAVKRGDLTIKYSMIPIHSKKFNFYPNEEQQKYIDQRSEELLVGLESRRKELGLPPFDNSPLESDRLKYELLNEDKESSKD